MSDKTSDQRPHMKRTNSNLCLSQLADQALNLSLATPPQYSLLMNSVTNAGADNFPAFSSPDSAMKMSPALARSATQPSGASLLSSAAIAGFEPAKRVGGFDPTKKFDASSMSCSPPPSGKILLQSEVPLSAFTAGSSSSLSLARSHSAYNPTRPHPISSHHALAELLAMSSLINKKTNVNIQQPPLPIPPASKTTLRSRYFNKLGVGPVGLGTSLSASSSFSPSSTSAPALYALAASSSSLAPSFSSSSYIEQQQQQQQQQEDDKPDTFVRPRLTSVKKRDNTRPVSLKTSASTSRPASSAAAAADDGANPMDRKLKHNMIDRNRRLKMKAHLDELADLVHDPEALAELRSTEFSADGGGGKPGTGRSSSNVAPLNKAEILYLAIRRIKFLRQELDKAKFNKKLQNSTRS